nr:hypothetical protein [Bacteroides intestinalis]
MKKLFVTFTFLVIGLFVTQAQEPFFAVKKGMILEYANKNAKGKINDGMRYTILETEVDGDNITVAYQVDLLDKKMEKINENPIEVKLKIIDGTIEFDPGSAFGKIMEGVEIKGTGLTLPENLSAGQKLKDYEMSITSLGVESKATNVIVESQEDITVEAGTFNAYKVTCNLNSKVLFIKTQGKSAAWYVRGIGHVRINNYNKKGKLISYTELINIEQ